MMRIHIAITTIVMLNLLTTAEATFRLPAPVPVDRIISAAEAQVRDNPKNAEAYYTLGRAHYLAWSLRSAMVPTYRDPARGGEPRMALDWEVSMFNDYLLRLEARNRVSARWKLPTTYPTDPAERTRFNQEVEV